MFDGERFGAEMVTVVRDAVSRAVDTLRAEMERDNSALRAENAALEARLKAVEAREIPAPFDPAPLREGIERIAMAVDAIPAPDLSGLATKEDVEAVRAAIPAPPEPVDTNGFATKAEVEAVREAIPAVPEPQDLSGFATKAEVEAVRVAIPAEPDLSGFATKAALSELRAAIPEVPAFPDLSEFATSEAVGEMIADVRAAIPEPADLSGFATKAEVEAAFDALPVPADGKDADPEEIARMVAEAVAALPPAEPGKDADPAEVERLVTEKVAEAMAALPAPKDGEPGKDADPVDMAEVEALVESAVETRTAAVLPALERAVAERLVVVEATVSERLASLRDGVDGVLPVAGPWEDRVYHRGEAATHSGSLWQAQRDTGKEPPHGDWICLAAKGEDGRTPEFVGTYDPDAEIRRLDVVALNGGSFVALRDNPGPCPSDGWQLVAGRGKPGQSVKGDKGDRGVDATEVAGLYRSGDEIVLTLGDGREFKA